MTDEHTTDGSINQDFRMMTDEHKEKIRRKLNYKIALEKFSPR